MKLKNFLCILVNLDLWNQPNYSFSLSIYKVQTSMNSLYTDNCCID